MSKNEIIKILASDRQFLSSQGKNIVNNKLAKDSSNMPISENNVGTTQDVNDSDDDEADRDNDDRLREADMKNAFEPVRNSRKHNKRNITILTDSTAKSIEAHRMQHDISPSDKVYLKSFPGAVAEDFHHYAKPSMKWNPNKWILHFGTNSLRSNKTPDTIAKEILDVALKLKTDQNCVTISGITYRSDKWNTKGLKVNSILKSLCDENAFGYIDNSNITARHLNNSGLHLAFSGTSLLAQNFIRHINA